MKSKNWFSVDVDGLAQLQAGRPKWHIVRELVQNSFDENVTEVSLRIHRTNLKTTTVIIDDDCPEGFKDLTDAFTLFGTTYKRSDPTKRGRFNLGEKQAIAQSKFAKIETTKGTVIFDESGRHTKRVCRERGSSVTLSFACKKDEHDEMAKQARRFVAPDGVDYKVDGEPVIAPVVFKQFDANALKTVSLEDGALTETYRGTKVKLYEANGDAWLYELGIPVIKIDCKYSVDIQQKIPLAMDRDSVRDSYLADVYAQVLNQTISELTPEQSSEGWVRAGAGHFEIKPETTAQIIKSRFGEKVATFTPGDKRSNDEAVANGYKLIHGSELSAAEWEQTRKAAVIPSSGSLFGLTPGTATAIEPTESMLRVAELAKRIARKTLAIEIEVAFIQLPNSAGMAWYGNRTLKFVVDLLPAGFFDIPIAPEVIDLIIHELGHECGTHTERTYLDALTRIGGELVTLALTKPEFFNV